jgi:hypothetical protein
MSASNVTRLRGGDDPIPIPPQSVEAEQGLLAAILYDNSVFEEVAGIVHREDFFHDIHRRFFAVIANEIGAGRVACAAMLRHLFLNNAAFEPGLASSYLDKIEAAVVTTHNAPDYAHIVADMAQKRAFIDAMQNGLDRVYADGSTETASELKAGLLAQLDEISRFAPDRFPEPADLLGAERVPAFPIDFLPEPLADFALDQSQRFGCPIDFFGIPSLIISATLIGKHFRMAPKEFDPWAERACLWGGIIAGVGSMKTPALNSVLAPIWRLQADLQDKHREELNLYAAKMDGIEAVKKQWKKTAEAAAKAGRNMPEPPDEIVNVPEKPRPGQIVTNDATQERVAELIMHNPRGIALIRDELSGWFAQFNQYRPGADEQFYLQCHVGGGWNQDRKSSNIWISDLYLSIFGGFQPDVVAQVLGRRGRGTTIKPDNGMTARFGLLVWPDPVTGAPFVDRSSDFNTKDRLEKAFRKLRAFDPEAFVGPPPRPGDHYPPLRFTPEAAAIFRNWSIANKAAFEALQQNDPLRGHFAKYGGLFAQLALVHHLIRYASGERIPPASVDDLTAAGVRDFIDDYLRPHALKIYGRLGRGTAYHGARTIAQWIVDNSQMASFTARDVSQKEWSGLTEQADVDAALTYLEMNAAWVRTEDVPAGPRGGRPTKAYVINPKVRKRK